MEKRKTTIMRMKPESQIQIKSSHKVTFECKTCGESYLGISDDYQSREFLENHLKKHIYNCTSCSKKFPTQKYLINHIEKIHLINYFFCANCEFRTHDKNILITHISSKHEKLVDHDCDKCGKIFENYKKLKNHLSTIHSPRQQLLCSFCGYLSDNMRKLRAHETKYHVKPMFKCKICKKSYMTEIGWKHHTETHKIMKKKIWNCEKCGKNFLQSYTLKAHKLTHTGDKPMKCTVCGASFAKRTTLRQHLLTHSGKRPYSCDICGKTFVQKPGLTGHRKSHPGIHPPLPKVYIDSFIRDVDPKWVAKPSIVPKIKIDGQTFENFHVKR